jgi:hypothetical protein
LSLKQRGGDCGTATIVAFGKRQSCVFAAHINQLKKGHSTMDINRRIKAVAFSAIACIVSSAAGAGSVSFEFTVDDTSAYGGDWIVQIGMYAQHGNGTTASAYWDNVDIREVTSSTPVFRDTFNDRSLTDETIGGNWTWYDTTFSDANCTAYVGGYGPWSDGDGSDYVHANNNYTRHGDNGGAYFRAGLVGDSSNPQLEVYQNQYATQVCNEIKVFKEFTNLAAGTYKFSAEVDINPYTPVASGNQVGVFFKVLDVAGGYAEAQVAKQAVSLSSSEDGNTNAGDIEAIPVLPLGGLLGLIGLVGWLGVRRRA